MNKLQHLLLKLAEESAEVAQIASKTMQFGPDDVMPGQPLNNFQRCHLELDDLLAVVALLNEQYSFCYTPNERRMREKQEKVQKYLTYSIELGLVSDS